MSDGEQTTHISDRWLEHELQQAGGHHQRIIEALAKTAFITGSQAAGGIPPGMDPSQQMPPPPMDPAMAAGGMPMDPAMAGGGMPMDPAMMDPAMMGGAPPMPGSAPELSEPITPEVVAQMIDERMAAGGDAGKAGKGDKPSKPDPIVLLVEQNKELMSLVRQLLGNQEAAAPPQPQEEALPGPLGADDTKLASEGYYGANDSLRDIIQPNLPSEESKQLAKSSSQFDFIMSVLDN